MSSENKVVDGIWAQKLKNIYRSDRNWVNSFCLVPEDERERFMEYDVENPQFLLCESAIADTAKYQILLEELLAEIMLKEKNEDVKELYRAKIERQIAFVPMYLASEIKDDNTFSEISKKQYGKPKKKYFNYIADRLKELIDYTDGNTLADEAKILAKVFSKIDTSKVDISVDILTPPEKDTGKTIDANEVASIFREVSLENDLVGWAIVVDEENIRTRFAVNPIKKIVYIPCNQMLRRRKLPMTELRARALAEHEVGVHALRVQNGENSNLQLLAYGLDGYLRGEEGVASYIQQQREGASEFYGFDRYLALSLACGLDGEERDFRSVFTIMKAYYQLSGLARNEKSAENAAWEVSIRCFRGTSGLSSGTVYTRDIAYLEGNIGIWNLLIDKPQVFPDLFAGKYDPLNQEHVKRLTNLGIISLI